MRRMPICPAPWTAISCATRGSGDSPSWAIATISNHIRACEPSGLVLIDRHMLDAGRVAEMINRHRGYIITAWREVCAIALQPQSLECWKGTSR